MAGMDLASDMAGRGPPRTAETPGAKLTGGAAVSLRADLLKLRSVSASTPGATRWYRRHVVLRGDFLLYYKDRSSGRVAGWVRLGQVSQVETLPPGFVAPGAELPREHVFRVVVIQRTLYFCATSAAEVTQWKTAILEAKDAASPPSAPTSPAPVQATAGRSGGRYRSLAPTRSPLPYLTEGFAAVSPASAASARSPDCREAFRPLGAPPGPSIDMTSTPLGATGTHEMAHFDDSDAAPSASSNVPSAPFPLEDLPGMPRIAWLRRWDQENGAQFFERLRPLKGDACTCWEIPRLTFSGEWISVWDVPSMAVVYIHSRTGEARCAAPGADPSEIPVPGAVQRGDGEATAAVTRTHPRDVVLELWDEAEGLPYYVNAATGLSQWEEPVTEGTVIVMGASGEDGRWIKSVLELGTAAHRAEAAEEEARAAAVSAWMSGPSPGMVPEGPLFPAADAADGVETPTADAPAGNA